MIKWIILSIILLIGIGAIILAIQLKDYKYPSQIYEENLKEWKYDCED